MSPKTTLRSVLILMVLSVASAHAYSRELVITFYNQRVVIQYDESIIVRKKLKANEKDFLKFHELMMKSQYQGFVESVQQCRDRMQLNDWLYYVLIDSIATSLDSREINRDYIKWFLLSKSGYKLRIAFSKAHVSIFAESLEDIWPLRRQGKSYCLNCKEVDGIHHVFPRFNPYKDNKNNFSFLFDPLPKFANTTYIRRTFRLKRPDSKEREVVEVEFDSVLMSCQRKIAGFNAIQTFSIPLTPNAAKLLERIEVLTEKCSDSVRVNYLMDFIARNSMYTPDEITFGIYSKYGSPEEFLFYGEGDCFERSAFLFYALKEILKKPLVIVSYPTKQHVNVAISLELKVPPNFIYRGKPYYTCEPTRYLGFIPLGKCDLYKKESYEIIGEYDPEKSTAQEGKQK